MYCANKSRSAHYASNYWNITVVQWCSRRMHSTDQTKEVLQDSSTKNSGIRFGYKLYTVVDDTGSLRRIADHQATTRRDWLICARHLPRTLATLSGLSTSHTTSHHSVPWTLIKILFFKRSSNSLVQLHPITDTFIHKSWNQVHSTKKKQPFGIRSFIISHCCIDRSKRGSRLLAQDGLWRSFAFFGTGQGVLYSEGAKRGIYILILVVDRWLEPVVSTECSEATIYKNPDQPKHDCRRRNWATSNDTCQRFTADDDPSRRVQQLLSSIFFPCPLLLGSLLKRVANQHAEIPSSSSKNG